MIQTIKNYHIPQTSSLRASRSNPERSFNEALETGLLSDALNDEIKKNGFTFIEMLITLVILAVLSTLTVSSYSYFLQKNEEQIIEDELRTAVQYSKMQAINLAKPVFLQPLDASLNWSNGVALSTLNKQTNKTELLYQWQWHHPRWGVTWTGVRIYNKVTFSNNPISAISNGRFTLTNLDTHQQVIIILNRLGRTRVSKGAN